MPRTGPARPILVGGVLLATLFVSFASAQEVVVGTEDYLAPPTIIQDVLTSAAMHGQESPSNLSPDGEHFLLGKSGGMPPLAFLARPYLNLGETPIDHVANRSRSLSMSNTIGYELLSWKTGERRAIQTPDGLRVSGATWSPDGRWIAFLGHEDDTSHVWLADAQSGQARRVSDRPVLASLTSSLRWTWKGDAILAVLIPSDRGPMPERGPVAPEPSVYVSQEGRTPSRTYRFLLKTPHDKALLEYFSTGQLALIDVESAKVTEIGAPAMFTGINVAPDGQHFRVSTMQKPFSYFVPRRSFGSKDELWNAEGSVVHTFSERQLREGGNRGGGRARNRTAGEEPKRSLGWRPDGAGMSFLQREPAPKKPAKAEAGKDAAAKGSDVLAGTDDAPKAVDATVTSDAAPEKEKKPAKRKDRVMLWKAPYDAESVEVVWASEDPISSVRYSEDAKTLFVTLRREGKTEIYAVDPAKPDEKRLVHSAKAPAQSEGARTMPGRRFRGGMGGLATRSGPGGTRVVRQTTDGKFVWWTGTEQPKNRDTDSPQAWIEKVEIGTGKKERVWTAAKDLYETIITPTDDDLTAVILRRESSTMVPNTFVRDSAKGTLRAITQNVDPAPRVTAARRERIQVTRVDGLKFWVDVTIPADYGQKLPALFWFYPREFTDQASYDRSLERRNPNRFPMMRTRSMELLTMLGYVLVRPDLPIIGPQGRMNDNYVADLRNGLWAVIDELDKREIIDRDRLAIGGHSYGAFSTANALAHTPFFKAGIAGNGNYNRTLTPMSFQAERRYIWDARETYTRMSPLLWANQVNGALLLYHGADDNNTGTFPIHSPRMFGALNGLGKPAALYVYPYEGHGPRSEETILDLWSRWVEWLDIHVKHPGRSKEMYRSPDASAAAEQGR